MNTFLTILKLPLISACSLILSFVINSLSIPTKRNELRYKQDKDLAKTNNKTISSKRIKIEHVFAYMKNFRILPRLNYYKTSKIELFFNSIAMIYNLNRI